MYLFSDISELIGLYFIKDLSLISYKRQYLIWTYTPHTGLLINQILHLCDIKVYEKYTCMHSYFTRLNHNSGKCFIVMMFYSVSPKI